MSTKPARPLITPMVLNKSGSFIRKEFKFRNQMYEYFLENNGIKKIVTNQHQI